MSIHQRIKDRRLVMGLSSHQALATLVGVSWQTVQLWEKEGGTAPNRSRIKKVAEVLGVTTGWLQNGDPGEAGPQNDASSERVVTLHSKPSAPPKWMEPEAFKLLDLYYGADGPARERIMRYAESLSGGGTSSVVSNEG